MKLSPRSILFLALVIAFTGCSETATQPLAEMSLDGTWTLTYLDGTPVPAEPPVTTTVTGDKISIQGPVNRINGTFTDGPLGPMMSTRMAGPPEHMDYETKLLAALEGATLQPASPNTFNLEKANKTVATFTRKQN